MTAATMGIAFWVLVIILVLLMASRGEWNLRRSKRALEISEENLRCEPTAHR
jgi:hypothetical protein